METHSVHLYTGFIYTQREKYVRLLGLALLPSAHLALPQRFVHDRLFVRLPSRQRYSLLHYAYVRTTISHIMALPRVRTYCPHSQNHFPVPSSLQRLQWRLLDSRTRSTILTLYSHSSPIVSPSLTLRHGTTRHQCILPVTCTTRILVVIRRNSAVNTTNRFTCLSRLVSHVRLLVHNGCSTHAPHRSSLATLRGVFEQHTPP